MILGIDLGTTYCAMARIDETGNPVIVSTTTGDETVPSVVMIDGDEVIVGEEAKRNAYAEPEKVCSKIKRSMGEKVTLITQNGKSYSPELLSSFIIRKLTQEASQKLNTQIQDVVITVPAGFPDAARKATMDAVSLVKGLRLVGMIDEPTASALYYCHASNFKNGKILIYDFGGGTFDATLLSVEDSNIRILAKQGIHNAGGVDFDTLIAEYMADIFKENHNVDLREEAYEDVYQELMIDAEYCKKTLSARETASIVIRAGREKEKITIHREEFNERIRRIYNRTEGAIGNILDQMGMEPEDVDKVLLVGGSSQIPYVREQLSKLFKDRISYEIDPNKSVALGAALYGELQKEKTSTGKSRVQDICGYAIGIVLRDKNNERINHVLIPPCSPVPARERKECGTNKRNQRNILLEITECANEEEVDMNYVDVISEHSIELPLGLPANTLVNVTMEVDEQQMLHVYVDIPDEGIEWECKIQRKSNMTEEEMEQASGLVEYIRVS